MPSMRVPPAAIIQKKRDGGELSQEEIAGLIRSFVAGDFTDYQMSAFAMAVYFQGMTADETAFLTESMLKSGDRCRWPNDGVPRVDKHSTGGVGDKVSLVLAPLLAACGVRVPMISGRGLGITGGTLDKLESVSGFRTALEIDEIEAIVADVGCCICGQSDDLVPADRKLYALRDVTATVDSIPLITASILSKKLAEGLDCLVMDVKWGNGAFMKTIGAARNLARSIVAVGRRLGLQTEALITDMNQPLGRMAGNAIEVLESRNALSGDGPEDLLNVTLELGSGLLTRVGKADSAENGRQMLMAAVANGCGREILDAMIAAQGGEPDAPLHVAPAVEIRSPRSGCVAAMDCLAIGNAIIALGGGRRIMTDAIDHSVGVETLVRIGDWVAAGQSVFRMFAHRRGSDEARSLLESAVALGDGPSEAPPLIVERICGETNRG